MSSPLVSVVMPAYNAEKYIQDSIFSVLSQSYTNWELIVVDDCSSDGTVEVVNRIINSNTEKSIFIYQNERNIGVAATRNFAVEKSRGDWIAFLDSDDLWTSDKLEKQVQLLSLYPDAPIVFSASAFIKNDGEKLNYILHVPERIDKKELLKQNVISCSSALVKKELLNHYPMPEISKPIHEDFATWLMILSDYKYAYGIDEPLLVYRLSNNSKSANKMRAAVMNWNTYQFIGETKLQSLSHMITYSLNSIKKYSHF